MTTQTWQLTVKLMQNGKGVVEVSGTMGEAIEAVLRCMEDLCVTLVLP